MASMFQAYSQQIVEFLTYEFQNAPYRLLIDIIIVATMFVILFSRSYTPKQKPSKLSKKDEEELLAEWKPSPLVSPSAPTTQEDSRVVVGSSAGAHITVNNKEVINLGSYNFLGLANDKDILQSCKQTIRKYGVGSCGPRGFYGTIDVHLQLEQTLKEFFNTEGCIVYSYGFCTISSVIPAFAKKGDVLVIDEACNFAIRTGADLSRTNVVFFKHNDMADLEAKLSQIKSRDKPGESVRQRRFIVVQGVYENTGNVAPLQKIVQLRNDYNFRIILDDSFGVGVLGNTGRGTVEHCGVEMSSIDIFCGGLEAALGSGGGFCAGAKVMTENQRLNGAAYCFSASSPPYYSVAAMEAVDKIQANPGLLKKLAANVQLMHNELKTVLPKEFVCDSSFLSPIFHVKLASPRPDAKQIFKKIQEEALDKGVAVVVPKYSAKDRKYDPSIRFTVSADHTPEDLKKASSILKQVFHQVAAFKEGKVEGQ